MPAALLERDQLVAMIMGLFRKNGYDGTSLSDVSAATGLGKSSLYHHFPGGKEAMAEAVLEHLTGLLDPVFAALRDERPPAAKLDGLLTAVRALYDDGRTPCLLERLCASVDRARFARPLAALFRALLDAFETLGREAGIAGAEARAHAEDAVVRIEGSLIVAAGTGDPRVFGRAIDAIRGSLLAGGDHPRRRVRKR